MASDALPRGSGCSERSTRSRAGSRRAQRSGNCSAPRRSTDKGPESTVRLSRTKSLPGLQSPLAASSTTAQPTSEKICAACCEPLEGGGFRRLLCTHTFHLGCISSYSECPICRIQRVRHAEENSMKSASLSPLQKKKKKMKKPKRADSAPRSGRRGSSVKEETHSSVGCCVPAVVQQSEDRRKSPVNRRSDGMEIEQLKLRADQSSNHLCAS